MTSSPRLSPCGALALALLTLALAAPLQADPIPMGSVGGAARATGVFGAERSTFEGARQRYLRALEQAAGGQEPETDRGPAPPAAVVLTTDETRALISQGWGTGRAAAPASPHRKRASLMSELARRLGHDTRVGVLQARFGTPQETGLTAVRNEIRRTRARLEVDPGNLDLKGELARLDVERRHLIERASPISAEEGGWASVNLDVNGDGAVDRRDLVALDRQLSTRPAAFVADQTE